MWDSGEHYTPRGPRIVGFLLRFFCYIVVFVGIVLSIKFLIEYFGETNFIYGVMILIILAVLGLYAWVESM